MVKLTLFARSVINLFFCAVFFNLISQDSLNGLQPGGIYAVLDGFMGLVMAAALARQGNGTWTATLCALDAMIRIFIGLLLLRYPNLLGTMFGSSFFFVTLITSCLAIGGIGVFGTIFKLLSNLKQPQNSKQLSWPTLMISISTILLGVGFAFNFLQESQRTILGAYTFVVSLIFMIAGLQSKKSNTNALDNLPNR